MFSFLLLWAFQLIHKKTASSAWVFCCCLFGVFFAYFLPPSPLQLGAPMLFRLLVSYKKVMALKLPQVKDTGSTERGRNFLKPRGSPCLKPQAAMESGDHGPLQPDALSPAFAPRS